MKRTAFAQQWIDKLKSDPQETFCKETFFFGGGKACALGKGSEIITGKTNCGSWVGCLLFADALGYYTNSNGFVSRKFLDTIYHRVSIMNDEGITGAEIAAYLETIFDE